MPVIIRLKKRPVGVNDMEGFESRIGMALPHDYREFLSEYNGGVPETNEFDIPGLNSGSGVNAFLSHEEIENEKKLLSDRFPPNAWPIAHTEGGNYVCLVLGERSGIYFWDHELEAEEGQPATWDNMFRLADSFSEFLLSLRPFDIDSLEIDPNRVEKVWQDPDFKPEFD